METDRWQLLLDQLAHLLQRDDIPNDVKDQLQYMQMWVSDMFTLYEIATPHQKGTIQYHINAVENFVNRPGHITLAATQQVLKSQNILIEPWQYLVQHGIPIEGERMFERLFDTRHGFYHYLYRQHLHASDRNGHDCRNTYRTMFRAYLGQCASSKHDSSSRPQPYAMELLCTPDCAFQYRGQSSDLQGCTGLSPDDVLVYLVCQAAAYPDAMLELFVKIVRAQCDAIQMGQARLTEPIAKATVLEVCTDYWKRSVRLNAPFPFT